MPNHDDSLEPSPAQLGETMTVAAGEWTPLDDHGTEIYVYGDHPVDIAVQVGAEEQLRQLRAEVEQLRRSAAEAEDRLQELRIQLDAIGSMQVVEHDGRGLRVITSAMHDRLCKAKVGTPQGTTPEVLHCAFCGFCYPPTTVTRPYLAEGGGAPMSDVKVDTTQVRAVLDAAIGMALPVSGGAVRKRLKQLRKALAENDAQRHAGYCPNCVMRCEGDHPPCEKPGGDCRMDRPDEASPASAPNPPAVGRD